MRLRTRSVHKPCRSSYPKLASPIAVLGRAGQTEHARLAQSLDCYSFPLSKFNSALHMHHCASAIKRQSLVTHFSTLWFEIKKPPRVGTARQRKNTQSTRAFRASFNWLILPWLSKLPLPRVDALVVALAAEHFLSRFCRILVSSLLVRSSARYRAMTQPLLNAVDTYTCISHSSPAVVLQYVRVMLVSGDARQLPVLLHQVNQPVTRQRPVAIPLLPFARTDKRTRCCLPEYFSDYGSLV